MYGVVIYVANVFDVAEYVLSQLGETSTMKLQKLVYYCQAWSLAWDGVPLFKEDFEAWMNGPVCPELYKAHKGTFKVKSGFFGLYISDDPNFSEDNIDSMNAVINYYGIKEAGIFAAFQSNAAIGAGFISSCCQL